MEKYQLIINDICEQHNISLQTLLSRRKKSHIMRAREEACLRLWATGLSMADIGWLLHRDHTSISHLLQKLGVVVGRGKSPRYRYVPKVRLPKPPEPPKPESVKSPYNQGKMYSEYLKEAEARGEKLPKRY